MRRFLGGVATMVVVGAASVGLWAGVGRAGAPAPVAPAADRVVALPAAVARPEPSTTTVAAAVMAPPSEPSPTPPVAPGGSVVISCAMGPDGAFVEVPSAGDCAGGAALRIEATVNA